MSQENVEIVRVCFEGFNRGEISDLLANLSEDCEWRPPAYAVERVSYLGRDAYAAWFEALQETWSSIRLTPTLWDVGDRHVVAEVRAENIGRASAAPINQLFWIVHTMDEGKIVRMDSFTSEAEALEAVGLRE